MFTNSLPGIEYPVNSSGFNMSVLNVSLPVTNDQWQEHCLGLFLLEAKGQASDNSKSTSISKMK